MWFPFAPLGLKIVKQFQQLITLSTKLKHRGIRGCFSCHPVTKCPFLLVLAAGRCCRLPACGTGGQGKFSVTFSFIYHLEPLGLFLPMGLSFLAYMVLWNGNCLVFTSIFHSALTWLVSVEILQMHWELKQPWGLCGLWTAPVYVGNVLWLKISLSWEKNI